MKIKTKFKKAKQRLRSFGSSNGSDGEADEQNSNSNVSDSKTSENKSSPKNQNNSSSSQSKTSADQSRKSVSRESIEPEMKEHKDSNFGKNRFIDTTKPAIWNVLVRIIEAKDIDTGGSSRVRVILDGKSKMTRVVTHVVPKWRQNILFTTKKQSLEKLADNPLTIKLVRPKFTGEVEIGHFSCYLSEVIHLTNKSVISKWVALGSQNEETDEDCANENCGFLKLSICVYRMDESPPQMIDDDGTEEIWSGAHLSDYTLKIRLFSIEMMFRKLIDEKGKGKKQQKFYLLIQCGNEKAETTLEIANVDEKQQWADIIYDQEVYIPISWPTVISQISISLFSKKGKKQRCVGKTIIPMKQIYEPGEEGFLPTFGPAYLNIFDCEKSTRFNWFVKGSTARQEDGSRFISRLFMSIDCVEHMDETVSQRLFLDHSSIMEAEGFMKSVRRYTAFCTMTSLNMINPLFASDAIQILISIGTFGSVDVDNRYCSSSTVAAMPNWDQCKYFAMPWGNLRPMSEVKCYFENIDYRIELSNSLMKMSNMLDRMIWEVLRTGNGALDQVASLGCETLDNLEQMIDAGIKFLEKVKLTRKNNLDNCWLQERKRQIRKLKDIIEGEMFDIDYSEDEIEAKLLRMMLRMRSLAKTMADDIQISIPPLVIKMFSFGKLIGFAKIPISEVYQSDNEVRSGEWCGRRRAINIQWPTLFDQKNRKEEFVAVLHATMWFGRSDMTEKWKEHVEPAEIRYFMDAYEVQAKTLALTWKPKSDAKAFLTGDGEFISSIPKVKDGWKTVGQWLVMNTHDMWMSNCGRQTMHDKAYEVQKKK
ncbi:unnamed protein product [Caenorhabditis angaria]|uniref:Ferlin B-domain domain-containing protein n=1 Tax=Caenorhabditis angaria TaxID=860376 RepID=A0A9P1MSX7_9PELO|nr:unnamed protein product [Caenorhabditis angaria]